MMRFFGLILVLLGTSCLSHRENQTRAYQDSDQDQPSPKNSVYWFATNQTNQSEESSGLEYFWNEVLSLVSNILIRNVPKSRLGSSNSSSSETPGDHFAERELIKALWYCRREDLIARGARSSRF